MISNKQKYFEEVYDANKDKIYRLCMGFTGNAVNADDLFQEIVLKIWTKLDSFRKESAISTWIYRVATNTALVYVNKKNKAAKNISNTMPEALAIQHVERDVSKEHQLNQLHRAIAQLKEIDRIIITLVLEECSYKEIANITGLNINHVGVKVNRIKTNLKNKMTALSTVKK